MATRDASLVLLSRDPPALPPATREECFVMSLVENLARRNLSPLELIREVGRLREQGYTYSAIGEKIGSPPPLGRCRPNPPRGRLPRTAGGV